MEVILWSSLGNTTVRESQHHMAERDPKVPPQEILDTNFNPLCSVEAHAHPEAVLSMWCP